MATTPTQIRIDSEIKKKALLLFQNLGIDMSSAVNMFLYQCILRNGLPFSVEMPKYSQETLEAMEEAIQISCDSNIPNYSTMEELKKALED